jgi:uncharacterized membrane protein
MITLDEDSRQHTRRIVLTPNRSISWPILLRFYLLTCTLSFSIAMLFVWMGYWVVLPFSGLEMSVLGIALYVSCRKIYQQEVISIDNATIKLQKGCIRVQDEWEFDRYWVRVSIEKQKGFYGKIKLKIGSHGNFIEIGSFLNDKEKESLAFRLNKGILTSGF